MEYQVTLQTISEEASPMRSCTQHHNPHQLVFKTFPTKPRNLRTMTK